MMRRKGRLQAGIRRYFHVARGHIGVQLGLSQADQILGEYKVRRFLKKIPERGTSLWDRHQVWSNSEGNHGPSMTRFVLHVLKLKPSNKQLVKMLEEEQQEEDRREKAFMVSVYKYLGTSKGHPPLQIALMEADLFGPGAETVRRFLEKVPERGDDLWMRYITWKKTETGDLSFADFIQKVLSKGKG